MLSNIKATLAARGVKQVDLALRLRMSPSVLSEIVNGRRKADPSLRARIASELRADEGWLFSSVSHIPAPRSSPFDPLPTPMLAAGRE